LFFRLFLLCRKGDQQLVLSQALGPYFLQIHTFLLSGCSLQPDSCGLLSPQFPPQIDAQEQQPDLSFLHSVGLAEKVGFSFKLF